MIWLVDYTHYKQDIDNELAQCKRDYFQIKTYKRAKLIGKTAPIKTKCFSTGLLRLATILHKNMLPVKYLHYDMLAEMLSSNQEHPQIVAFSAVCPTVPRCAELAKLIKEKYPNCTVKIGGVHVNYNAEETKRRYPIFDETIVGYEHEGAEKIANKSLIPVNDIYIDYALLPFPIHEYAINTFSAMGCPFACGYCVDGLAPRFIAQPDGNLHVLKQLLPERNLVHFFDSALGYSQEGLKTVCEKIAQTNHNFILSCDMRADILTPELVQAIQRAGFKEIRMGVESADEELLKRNGRTLTPSVFQKQAEMVRKNSDLYITLYSITGLAGTTWAGQEKTLDFFDTLFQDGLADEIKNAMYVPYPMQGLDYAKRGVYITNENWRDYDRQSFPVYHTDDMTENELWKLYVHTAKRINESWLKSIGFSSYEEIPDLGIPYAEYVESSYLKK